MEKNCSFTTVTTPGIVLLGTGENVVLKVDFTLHQNIFKPNLRNSLDTFLQFYLRTLILSSINQNIFGSNLRDSLDTFLEKNPDLTEEEVANPERMVGIEQ